MRVARVYNLVTAFAYGGRGVDAPFAALLTHRTSDSQLRTANVNVPGLVFILNICVCVGWDAEMLASLPACGR